jgi:hypothetical protein
MKSFTFNFKPYWIVFNFFWFTYVLGQTPEKMTYQAVVRNSSDALVCNQAVGTQISILQGSATGTAIYVEIHTTTTNTNGLMTLEIGNGTVESGQMSNIDWAAGPYFLKTETDPNGGTNYTITGVSQLLSVPFALHAKTAETLSGDITETDPFFKVSPAYDISASNITNWNNAFNWGNHASAGYLTSFTETDPLFSTSPSFGISGTNITNWNQAFNWGNHASAGYLTSFTETDPLFGASPSFGISGTNITNWNQAFNWGNHASAGYLTSFTETDPLFSISPSFGISGTNITNWNQAFNWGNHATAGYLTSFTETDPLFGASPSFGISGTNITNWNQAFNWGNHALAGYLTSFTETDPLFSTSPSFGISGANITNWNNAFNWGNHATAGYLTSFTERDPLFGASPSFGISGTNITNWNQAFNWGNHATAGYLTIFTETDPVWTTESGNYYTKSHLQTAGSSLIHFNNLTDKPTTLSGYGITNAMSTAHPANEITEVNKTYWNLAHSWGNHALAGYLTSYTETDPLFGTSPASSISGSEINHWNDAFNWGNHATQGYLTGFTESDPQFNASVAQSITAENISNWNNKLDTEVDGSVSNEIQTLSIVDHTIHLTNGGSVLLPNYISSLNITNDSLYVNYSHGEMLNVGYVGNGSPGTSLATIATVSISNLNYYDTDVLASITSIGNEFILNRGICLSTLAAPDLNDIVFHNGNGPGDFTTTCDNLLPNTLYHVRAFATNSVGTSYGNELTFTTKPLSAPILETLIASNITNTTAISGGNITDDGGLSITDRGICWSTDTAPDLSDHVIHEGEGDGNYLVLITGLTGNVTYYIRAFATNSLGTSYGNEISFNTITYELATVVTNNATDISYTNVTAGGNVTNDNGSTVTERGVCWATTTNPTTAHEHLSQNAGLGTFTFNITGLTANTPYFLRAYAINGGGTSYGNEVTFTTIPTALPMVSTKAISGISSNIAGSGGIISSDGGLNISDKGVCWSINPNPTLANTHTTDGTGNTNFNSTMTGLNPLTTYYVIAYATNALGTTYGNELSFTTTDLVYPGPSVPSVGTIVTTITSGSTAASGGYISSDGGSTVTERGVCWSTSENPTIADNHSSDGTGVGYFNSTVSGISGCGNVYYVKAYATNTTGTGYGNQVTVTSGLVATVNTLEVTNIDNYSATCGGSILDTGGCELTQKGVCWNYSPNPTTANYITTEGPGNSDFTSTLTNLLGNRTIYVKAYVTNSKGTTYGPEKVFTTLTPPTPYIGQDYAGGKVFYIDGTGQHGMVAVDTNTYKLWGCYGTFIGGTQIGIGTGATNTAIIVAGCTEDTAAKYCDDLVLNSYSDWYLPSKDEIYEIYIKLIYTNLLTNYNIWSSSESSNSRSFMIYSNGDSNINFKDNFFKVIPVRSF